MRALLLNLLAVMGLYLETIDSDYRIAENKHTIRRGKI